MSGGIEEPYTIAQLPKPIDADCGCITAAPVHSIAGSRKRKRHEVAIGVDGEGINIYNTQNHSIVSSYALPPQSYLAAPPCSIYRKQAKPSRPQRQTYITLRDGPQDQKLRILSFTEHLGRPRDDEREPKTPVVKRERRLRQSHVASLDIVLAPTESGGDEPAVLIMYRNGDMDCLSCELSATRWEYTRESQNDEFEVEYAALVDLETARKGLLKSREDVLAFLDTPNPAANLRPLLIQVTRSEARRTVRLFVIESLTEDSLHTRRTPVEELLTYDLPLRYKHKSQAAQYEVHAATGMLYQRLGKRLTIFDLSDTTPRISFQLGKRDTLTVQTFSRLSPATVLVISQGQIAVYDTKYSSILSSVDYPSASQRDRKGGTNQAPLYIITQSADLGIVVALSGHDLVAFQIGDILDDGRRATMLEPRLLDVLGKGKYSTELPTTNISVKKRKRVQSWEDWKSKVDQLFEDRDVDGLENLVAKEIALDGENEENTTNGTANGPNKGVDDGYEHSRGKGVWYLAPHTYDPQRLEGKKVMYILSNLFAWRRPQYPGERRDQNIEITLLSSNLNRWLAMAGYLTAPHIQHVLPQSVSWLDTRPRVRSGDIMKAVHDADSSFMVLCDLISLPVHWDIAEIVQGLQILIRSLQDRDAIEFDGHETENANTQDLSMAEDDEDVRVQAAMTAVTKKLDEASSILESGLAMRSTACRTLLARLQAFPQKDVVKTMHQMLTHEDIQFFISILRLELHDGGWKNRYFEKPEEEEEEEVDFGSAQHIAPSNQAMRTIAKLFSCAIDAIGLSGWMIGLSAEADHTSKMLQEMRNEVSAAMQGLYEAVALLTCLKEVGNAAGSMEQQHSRQSLKRKWEEEPSSEEHSLPLGGRLEPLSTAPKKIKRAAVAEEKSRSVSKYSFERIRI